MKRTSMVTPADLHRSLIPDPTMVQMNEQYAHQEATNKAISQFIWFFINNLPQVGLASFANEAEDKAVLNPFVYFPVKQVTCKKAGHDDISLMLTAVQMTIFPQVEFKIQGKMKIIMAPPMFDRVKISGRQIRVYYDRINPKEEWQITI